MCRRKENGREKRSGFKQEGKTADSGRRGSIRRIYCDTAPQEKKGWDSKKEEIRAPEGTETTYQKKTTCNRDLCRKERGEGRIFQSELSPW